MARAYLRLAEQAEHNAHNDLVYEIRLHRRIAINHKRDESATPHVSGHGVFPMSASGHLLNSQR